jgi:hypothetical protein
MVVEKISLPRIEHMAVIKNGLKPSDMKSTEKTGHGFFDSTTIHKLPPFSSG